jgi:acetyl-CoA carboxylase carboxyl transferase subunit beta
MSWFQKLIPPKIKRRETAKKVGPEGLWSKCPSCEAVLYAADLDNNMHVCPHCGYHNRIGARQRLEMLLDEDSRNEIGANILPVDALKFKDSRRYTDRISEAVKATEEQDALVVMEGRMLDLPVTAAAFEFRSWAVPWARWLVSVSCVAWKLPSVARSRSSALPPAAARACRKA